ncbi:hypothetical protein ACJRO7_011036 [Eucalyptus globulus]|uniref:UspA domain-containing protein n=1 Tax=Eucalyptus globulus TaxID=34317 RepID=A0ABD3LDW7_EUCGL
MPDLSKLRKLRKLRVAECLKVRSVEGLNHLKSLQKLWIHDCGSLESLTDTSNLDLELNLFSSDMVATTERYNEMADCVTAKAKKICDDFGEVAVETRVENGDARDAIYHVAPKLAPDVLVKASHGYSLIKRAFQRSVNYHHAQNVKCPMLVVKRLKISRNIKTQSAKLVP